MMMEPIESYDGMLILLPGSKTDNNAVERLYDITKFDRYSASVKLKTKLPLPLCRCIQNDMLGETGDRLRSCGISFFVLDRLFYEAPFQSKAIIDARFEASGCQFFDNEKRIIDIPSAQEVCLLEATYRTNMKETLASPSKLKMP